MGKKLVIDVLIYKRGKAFGYQEYMINLLDYFYQNYLNFNFEEIILATSESEKDVSRKKIKSKKDWCSFVYLQLFLMVEKGKTYIGNSWFVILKEKTTSKYFYEIATKNLVADFDKKSG